MTLLGKCLVFHFKYPAEMQQFFWDKPAVLDSVDVDTLSKIEAVGKKSREEAADFLEKCGSIIESRFHAIGNCGKPALSERKWSVTYGIWPKGCKVIKKNWKMQAGVQIPKDGKNILVWLWGTGKEKAEQRIKEELDGIVKTLSHDVPARSGQVVIAQIPIPTERASGFEIDADALLKQVEAAFEQITATKFGNIYLSIKNL